MTINPALLETAYAEGKVDGAVAERARIAKWLRAQAEILADMIHSTSPDHDRHLADLIERGAP